jgi:hypothetical protein
MNKYDELFEDHMEIALTKFVEKNKKEPTIYELIEEFEKLMSYFYEDCNASLLIFAALAFPYFDCSFL